MRSRYSIVALAVATVFTALLFSSEVHGQTSQDECEEAYGLLTENRYEDARDEYNALIRASSEDSEQTMVQGPTTNGEQTPAQEQAGAADETTEDDQGTSDCVDAGLKLVAIFTLANLGLHDQAREKLTTFITEHPETKVPPDLKYLFGGKRELWTWWPYIKVWGIPLLLTAAEVIATIVATIAIVALAYVALRRRVIPWVRNFFHKMPFLDVQDFESEVESMQGGKGFATMVEEQLGKTGGSDSGLRPGIVSAPAAPLEVPASLLPTPYLKILSQLIGWVVPQRIVTLSGNLLAPGDQGSGLTLTLTESWTGKVIGNRTMWEKDYGTPLPVDESPNPESYYGLAEAAAIWASSSINERYPSRGEGYD